MKLDDDDRHPGADKKDEGDAAWSVRTEGQGASLAPVLFDGEAASHGSEAARDDVADRFFAHATEATADADAALEDPSPPARFETPAIKARQRYLMRYVAAAVAASSAICVAAFVRMAIASSPPVDPPAPQSAVQPPAPAPTATPAPTPAPAPAPTATPAPASALDDRHAAMKALERGDWRGAITAGERSVHADATDAEAWLILGGAYQERGAAGRAHDCYVTCSRSAKPGRARSECAALAR